MEVPDAGEPRTRLCPARNRPAVCLGTGGTWRGLNGAALDAVHGARLGTAPIHTSPRRSVCVDWVRHEGRPRADAYVEARCVPRSTVAGGRDDGSWDVECRVVLPAPSASDLEGCVR